MRLTGGQWELANLMSDISETCYFAGWMLGLEYALWRMVVEDLDRLHDYRLTPEDRVRFKALAEREGGWVVFRDESGETFVPLAEWQEEFRLHMS